MHEIRPRMLCVEDVADECEMITRIFRGFDVISAATMLDGCIQALRGGFAIILIDYYLPDGNGATLCSNIRAFDTRTPILFVTSATHLLDVDVRRLGANGTVRKAHPMFIEQLIQRVGELIH